ncbi:MAG: glycosyltransferase family 1 protein [Eubacterium sp.]|nr:glycosyltransferase family 1 protein [Eubacterium sp.]
MNDNVQRILLVFGKLNRGGAETLAMNIFRKIDKNKIIFDFAVHTDDKCDYDEEILKLGGRIYHFPRYNIANHFYYKKCWTDFFDKHPEYKIIHTHMSGSAAIFLSLAKNRGIFNISHSHTVAPKNGLRQVIVNSYRFPLRYICDYMFGCSDQAGQWMFGKRIIKKSNYKTIKNGIDINRFVYSKHSRDAIRKEFNINENVFVLGNVARFDIAKNHIYLIDIFKELHRINSNTKLLLVGDGLLRSEIEQKITALGLKNDVILTGVRKDVADILSAMDCFVMPSVFEGLPLSVIEAQASGLPCLLTDSISCEVKCTDLVEFCSINESPSVWAQMILKYSDGYKRENTKNQLAAAGYDIQETANWLQNFYLEHSK